MPVRGDIGLITFISSVKHTTLPSIEVSLTRKGIKVPDAAVTDFTSDTAESRKRGRQARDKVETLEDSHQMLLKGIAMMTRKVQELERVVGKNQMKDNVEKLRASDRSILEELDIVRKHGKWVE